MFEALAIGIAFVGSTIAGIWDLFTTEVPDEVPALMIVLGIFNWYVYAVAIGDFMPLFISLAVGTLLLVIGLILYKAGHWGGADAWLLAALGYLIPLYNGQVFMPEFIFNFLIIGSVYMTIYALALGIKNRSVFSYFLKDLKENSKMLTITIIASLFSVSVFYMYSHMLEPTLKILALMIFLVFFWRYAVIVENRVFKKKIKSSQLKAGDVLVDMLWRGLTDAEVAKIRRTKKYVVIKDGVRFVPAFPISLLATLLLGNLMFYIV